MKGIRERLEQELRVATSRLHKTDAGVALAELRGVVGDNTPFADEVDEIQENELREIGFATRTLLVERVHRLRDALARLRNGDYGTCVECGEPIAPARLRAMPEVQTCVRCQDRLERVGRYAEPVEAGVSAEDDD